MERRALAETRAAGASALLDHATVAALTRSLEASAPASRGGQEAALLEDGASVASRYRVTRRLKEGGMGVVFEARDLLDERPVALKVMRPELRGRTDLVRFRHEYYLMATLRHPRLVEVRDFVLTDAGLPCLVMELVGGHDLIDVLPLPWDVAARALHQVASALAYLHSRRYIHHDLKPGNVRVFRAHPDAPLEAKLIDFGIMEPIGTAHRSGLAGTPAYLPPEALFGAPSDHRLDLYSLGVMACELVTGKIPFHLEDAERFLLEKQLEPPDVRRLLVGTPPEFAQLVSDLMAIDPAARPYDASVVLRRLRQIARLDGGETREQAVRPYLRPSRLVGRDAALASLNCAFLGTDRAPALALVRGATGLGKSALIREFRLRARLQGAITHEAVGKTSAGAFGTLRELLEGVVPMSRGASEQALEAQAGYLIRVLPALEERYPGLESAPHHPDPAEERRKLTEAVGVWLAALLEDHRMALFVDDAQLADAASIECLRALAADPRLGGLSLVVAFRPEAATGDTPLARLASGEVTDIELGELDSSEVGELLISLFGAVDPYPKLVSALAEAGQRNPSLLVEIIRRLVDDGVIEFRDERWHLPRELGELPLPATLGEAVASRLSALEPAARQVLDALVVVATELPLELLPRLTGLDEAPLFAALDQLVVAELADGQNGLYRVSRSVDRERLHAALDPERRRVLHRRAGLLLEQHYAAASARHAGELAEHFCVGEERTKALHYLRIAASELYDAQALSDAVKPLGDLERLLIEDGAGRAAPGSGTAKLLLVTRQRLARVGLATDSELADRYFLAERRSFLAGVPDPGEAKLSGPRALRLARVLAPELAASFANPRRLRSLPDRLTRYFTATAYHAATLALKGSFAEAHDVAESLTGFIHARRSRANGAYNVCRAIALTHQGRVREAEQACVVALELFGDERLLAGLPKIDVDSGLGGLYTGLTLLHAARGRKEARVWLTRFEEFVTEREHTLQFLMPNLFLAQIEYHLHRGEVRLVEEVARRYKAHHAQAGRYNAHVEMQILVGLARAALAGHNLAAAESLCAALEAQRPGDFFSHGWGGCVSGELWRLQRLYERSRQALSGALEYATRPGERSFKLELRALNALGELELDEDQVASAEGFARRALELASDASCASEYEELWALRTLASTAAARGRESAAKDYAGRIESLAQRLDNPLFHAVGEKVRGELCRAFGHGEDASQHISAARALFDSLGYLPTTVAPSRASSRDSSPIVWSQSSSAELVSSPRVDTAETLLAAAYQALRSPHRSDDESS